jgi:tRNA G10  N-methylase Trm11
VREVRGYRGSSAPSGRRGLPVIDARLLVNLVFDPALGTLVDPFAGAGGVAIEAVASGWRCVSADIDPSLRFGLARINGRHCIADARALPLRPQSIDAVATEPPYDAGADEAVRAALRALHAVLRCGGRIAMLCAVRQAMLLRREAAALGLVPYLEAAVDRKGTEVVALAWQR